MRNKELIKKLNSLKGDIKPSKEWMESNRSVLLSQISNGEKEFKSSIFFDNIVFYFRKSLQPSFIPVYIMLFFIIGGGFSWKMSDNSKPGDSFYVAKKISEKAQFAVTFDEKSKTKLNIEFAVNRAKEAEEVIKEEKDDSVKVEKTASLSNEFKKEISSAKARLEKIGYTKNTVAVKPKVKPTTKNTEVKNNNENNNEFFSATLKKDNKGLDISLKNDDKGIVNISNEDNATSTSKENDEQIDPKKILEEAEKLFENKDFSGAAEKLEKVNEVITK